MNTLHQREETEVKQTIEVEVEVGPEDDAGTCLVVLGGTRHERWHRDTVLGFGLTIPESEPPPAPERTEYRLIARGNGERATSLQHEVLVAAHSVRAGDRVEWAPGDWREITDVQEHCLAITLWIDDEPFSLNRWDLVAVRR